MEETTTDEPLTPGARLFLVPEFNQSIVSGMGLRDPVTPEAIEVMKQNLANSMVMKHPRFTSILVTDEKGRQHWRKTKINLDDHCIIHYHYNHSSDEVPATIDVDSESYEDIINDYLADFSVGSSLSRDKPLWEVHLIVDLRCIIWRVHHALGDGISLTSMLLESCRMLANPDQVPELMRSRKNNEDSHRRRKWPGPGDIWKLLKVIWFTLIYVAGFIGRSLGVKDKTVISGGEGVELWPRKIATAKFSLEDMKTVKRSVPNSTINDVLFGLITSGLSRYLEIRSGQDMKGGQQITGLSMVNLRESKGLQEMSKMMEEGRKARWGNEIGFILLPTYYHRPSPNQDPLEYVKRAKSLMDSKKLSLEAYFMHKTCDLLTALFGPQTTARTTYTVTCNTTFFMSNMAGPQEEITVAGNPVTFLKSVVTSIPQAILMFMTSYNGSVSMQVLVAKDIIPDPKFLAKCFEDAFLDMKNAAEGKFTKPKHA
ncbi:hypothetical protein Droror1_Dr00005818 [Drosera rotundifolia]